MRKSKNDAKSKQRTGSQTKKSPEYSMRAKDIPFKPTSSEYAVFLEKQMAQNTKGLVKLGILDKKVSELQNDYKQKEQLINELNSKLFKLETRFFEEKKKVEKISNEQEFQAKENSVEDISNAMMAIFGGKNHPF